MSNMKILYYDAMDIYDVNKASEPKEFDICYYWYFLNKRFKFQSFVCNRWHDVVMMSINLSDIAILNIEGADYCYIISGIGKSEAIHLMQNIDLTKKSKTL